MKSSKINHAIHLWQRHVVCILALLVVALAPAHASQVTSGVSFAQISFIHPDAPEKYSHYGQISVDYTMLYGKGYINVERYDNGSAVGWVVQNLPVISGSVLSGFSAMFDLGASGYQSSFTGYVDFSPTPLTNDSSLEGQVPLTYRLAQAEFPLAAPKGDPGAVSLITKVKAAGQASLQWSSQPAKSLTSVIVPITVEKDDTPEIVAKKFEDAFKKAGVEGLEVKAEKNKLTANKGRWTIKTEAEIAMALDTAVDWQAPPDAQPVLRLTKVKGVGRATMSLRRPNEPESDYVEISVAKGDTEETVAKKFADAFDKKVGGGFVTPNKNKLTAKGGAWDVSTQIAISAAVD